MKMLSMVVRNPDPQIKQTNSNTISKWVWPHYAVGISAAVLMGENCSTFNNQAKQSKAAIDDEDVIHGGNSTTSIFHATN